MSGPGRPIAAAAAPWLREALAGRCASWPSLDEATAARLVAALDQHGVLPLLHDASRAGRLPGLPGPVRAAAAVAYAGTTAMAAVWSRELASVLARLAGAGIVPALLKGAATVADYPDAGLRPMGDLDLLFRADEVPAAGEAVEHLGYRRVLEDVEAHRHHRVYRRVGPGGVDLVLELHGRLLASPPYDRLVPTTEVLRRATEWRAGGAAALRPCAVDELLHLAGHLVLQHPREERLIWVADVDRVARSRIGPAEWAVLAGRARDWWLAGACADALDLAALWFATPVDAAASAALATSRRAPGEARTYRRLRARPPVGAEGARLLADVAGIVGWRPRLAFALAHALPPPERMRAWYRVDGRRPLLIYYGRRLVRGTTQIARHRMAPEPAPPIEAWMIDP